MARRRKRAKKRRALTYAQIRECLRRGAEDAEDLRPMLERAFRLSPESWSLILR